MKTIVVRALCLLALLSGVAAAQEEIPLYPGAALGKAQVSPPYQDYISKSWHIEIVTNVTRPTLTVFKPSEENRNGTAVVICPGGGFLVLDINHGGNDVAQYLAAKGVTAFVLRYRLAHTGDDGGAELAPLIADKEKFAEMLKQVTPLAFADGLAAVAYVRQHAAQWGVSPDRVGIMGFSAGGGVTASVAFHYTPESRPAFVAPIYEGGYLADDPVPADGPPMFLAVANDDNLGLNADSVALYQKWSAAHKSAELHIYAKGGHGFAGHRQNLPADHWIDQFTEWLAMQGLLTK
jgi:acetyl esterase/lipase